MTVSELLRVRDPVHGFIPYSQEEARLIDSSALQRLRGIKQLAMTSLVYPGATHTRFEHSIGVMHIAGRVAEKVELKKKERRLVRLAALLHDIGHLPFSHAGEAAAAALTPKLTEYGEEAHEKITAALIQYDPEISGVLTERDRGRILGVLAKDGETKPLLWQIISYDLDADKLDYLLRDSLMAGVKYGVFDIDRMIDTFVKHGKGDDQHLAVRKEDLPCVEQVILARYYMSEQVYRHPVRRITDAMLKHAIISSAKLAGEPGRRLSRLFRCEVESASWRSQFLSSNDASVLSDLIQTPARTLCGKMARRLVTRRLLKHVFDCRMKDIPEAGVSWRERLSQEPERQAALAKRLAKSLEMDDKALLLLDVRQQGNPLYRDPALPLENDIRVLDEDGRDERLGDIEGSLSQKVKVEEEAQLCVYAAADGATRGKRRQMYRAIRTELSNAAREAKP